MSWASDRKTTRAGNVAYYMLGLFGVHMPLLYGEGENAFQLLELRILEQKGDESIFAWADLSTITMSGLLARNPSAFRNSVSIQQLGAGGFTKAPFMMTNKGLRLEMILLPTPKFDESNNFLVPLSCINHRLQQIPLLVLHRVVGDQFYRYPTRLVFMARHKIHEQLENLELMGKLLGPQAFYARQFESHDPYVPDRNLGQYDFLIKPSNEYRHMWTFEDMWSNFRSESNSILESLEKDCTPNAVWGACLFNLPPVLRCKSYIAVLVYVSTQCRAGVYTFSIDPIMLEPRKVIPNIRGLHGMLGGNTSTDRSPSHGMGSLFQSESSIGRIHADGHDNKAGSAVSARSHHWPTKPSFNSDVQTKIRLFLQATFHAGPNSISNSAQTNRYHSVSMTPELKATATLASRPHLGKQRFEVELRIRKQAPVSRSLGM